jgi:hypothetical protein
MKLNRLVASAFVAVALVLAPLGARAQVLQQVPADALVVIKFNKLKATSDKVAALANKLGLAQMNPDMADPLGKMQEEAGIKQGVDSAGDAAFVLLNNKMDENKPPMLVLVPVTDYKAFLGNFADAKTEGDISTVHPKNETNDVFVANWGKYAALSPAKENLAKKPDGLTPTALSAKELDSKDVVAYVNMKTARTRILPEIANHRAKILADIEKNMMQASAPRPPRARAGQPAPATRPAGEANAKAQKMMPVIRAFVNRAIDTAEQLCRDADGASYGLAIDEAGIKTTGLLEFAAGSPSAARVAEFKNTDASFLAGLPTMKYLLLGGWQVDPKAMEKLVSDFTDPIAKEFAALGEDGKAMQAYLDAMKKFFSASTGQGFGMLTPSGNLGQDAVIQAAYINRGDAKTLIDAQREIANSQQAFMNMFQPGGGAGIAMKTTYTANAKTVDGIPLNQMTTAFITPPGQPASPQVAQMQQMMGVMYGPGGINLLTGQINDKVAVTSMGISDEALKTLIASAKANDDKLSQSAALAATKKNLPQTRFAEMYVSLDQIAVTLASYAKAFGMPINFQVPPDLAPIGMTLGTEGGNALKGNGFIPAQTLQSLIAAGMQTYMQMQGGQQPGGPGGL